LNENDSHANRRALSSLALVEIMVNREDAVSEIATEFRFISRKDAQAGKFGDYASKIVPRDFFFFLNSRLCDMAGGNN
jgi:hypothetical protein